MVDWVHLIEVGGVGLVLALMLFFAFRSQTEQMRRDRMFMEDRMNKVIDQYNQNCREQTTAQVQHTQALTELLTWLKARNGHH